LYQFKPLQNDKPDRTDNGSADASITPQAESEYERSTTFYNKDVGASTFELFLKNKKRRPEAAREL
jgi:hypothetical protein